MLNRKDFIFVPMIKMALVKKQLSRISLSTEIANHAQLSVDSESDVESISESINWIESMFPERIVILCHMKHQPAAPYVSACCQEILGYTKTEFQSYTPEHFFSLIHPDDMENVREGLRGVEHYLKTGILHKLRFVFYYRLRHKNGRYISLRDERVTILTKGGKHVFFILLNENNIDGRGVSFEVLEISGNRFRTIQRHTPLNAETSAITSRELDVVSLISKGLSNLEISEALFISVSTVKKHRYSLFKKTNSVNSHHLINFAKMHNLIKE